MKIDKYISGEGVEGLVGALLLMAPDDESILDANAEALDCYGYTRDRMLSKKWSEIRSAELQRDGWPKRAAKAGVWVDEQHRRSDGTLFPVEVRSAAVGTGRHAAILRSVRDMSHHAEVENALRILLNETLEVVGRVAEMHESYIEGHQRRVAELADEIGRDIGMSESDLHDMGVAALIHDIGKTLVPAEILMRPGTISLAEYILIQRHCQTGYDLITAAEMGDSVAELVYQHHERCDGSGYPRGLLGDQLLDGAKVLMVADTVEAMTAKRPYREGLGTEAALAEIEQGAGRCYDQRVADSCIRLFRERGFEFS